MRGTPEERSPSFFEPATLVVGAIFAVVGVIIGLELMTRVGIAANTSIIAAITAIGASRIPLPFLRRFRSIARQNLLQTVISAATFGGANGLLLPIGLLWLIGRAELIPVMLAGALAGLLIDATILYRLFDSKLFPATGLWPSGVATAECILAGDSGGERAKLLAIGGVAGAIGHPLGIPMDIVGVCWIGNIWALFMFGLGLLIRGYALPVLGVDVHAIYLPHGVMIGAGLVAVIQIGAAITRRADGLASGPSVGPVLARGFSAFAVAAGLMSAFAGLWAEMSLGRLVGFVLFAATAALVSELVVGIAAMHAGWFPAFATALIFLLIGIALGFPSLPLTFLVGFAAATGPAFADMGYDLKAGWILRGKGGDPALERYGRRHQYAAEIFGLGIAAIAVFVVHEQYFSQDLFPPWDRVAVATIAAGASTSLAKSLALWAVPGAFIQAIGGPNRQLGVLLATGLLILNPIAGWTAIVALGVRLYLSRKLGERAENPMYVLAGGFIAGSALTSFGSATLKLK